MAKSMGYNMAGGLQGMLKDGHTSFEGVDEAIMRNIDAAKQLADIVKTSLGPNGKLVCFFNCFTQCRLCCNHSLLMLTALGRSCLTA
jgi:hypothetical protein